MLQLAGVLSDKRAHWPCQCIEPASFTSVEDGRKHWRSQWHPTHVEQRKKGFRERELVDRVWGAV